MSGVYFDEATVSFSAKSENEAFARMVASAFVMRLNPGVADLADVKTAVSEAVTNAIIHGYEDGDGIVTMKCAINGRELTVEIADSGVGIGDVALAREPLYTSKPELERSGMGFTVMETFMDDVTVTSEQGKGTTVVLKKVLP